MAKDFDFDLCSLAGCPNLLKDAQAMKTICWKNIGKERVYFCSRRHRQEYEDMEKSQSGGGNSGSDEDLLTLDEPDDEKDAAAINGKGGKKSRPYSYKPRGMYRPRMPRMMSSNAARAIYWSNVIMTWLGKGGHEEKESEEHYKPKTSFPSQAAPSLWNPAPSRSLPPSPPPPAPPTGGQGGGAASYGTGDSSAWRAGAYKGWSDTGRYQDVSSRQQRKEVGEDPIDAHWEYAKRNAGKLATSTTSASGMATSQGGPKEMADALRKATVVIEKLIEHLDKSNMSGGNEPSGTSMVPFGGGGVSAPPPGMQMIVRKRTTLARNEVHPGADMARRQIG